MPRVSSNHLRESGKPPSASSARPSKTSRPGWPEIIVGLVVYLIVGFGGVSLFKQLGLDPVVHGLILAAWTGVATLIAFTAAIVAGLATAEVFRRSGSIWPALVVHVVFNLPTIPVMVAAGMG